MCGEGGRRRGCGREEGEEEGERKVKWTKLGRTTLASIPCEKKRAPVLEP